MRLTKITLDRIKLLCYIADITKGGNNGQTNKYNVSNFAKRCGISLDKTSVDAFLRDIYEVRMRKFDTVESFRNWLITNKDKLGGRKMPTQANQDDIPIAVRLASLGAEVYLLQLENAKLLESLRELQAWATDAMGPEGTPIPNNHPIMEARAVIDKFSKGGPK